MPDVWEDIQSPIKNYNLSDYRWQVWKKSWKDLLKDCPNAEPLSGPQTHSVRISKEAFEKEKKEHVKDYGGNDLQYKDPLSRLLLRSSDILTF